MMSCSRTIFVAASGAVSMTDSLKLRRQGGGALKEIFLAASHARLKACVARPSSTRGYFRVHLTRYNRCALENREMSFASEFKEFALKGNVMDLAVGVIIGGAFGKIVDSIVKDLIMPVVNFVLGGQVDFTNKYWVLTGQVPPGASLAEAQKVGTVFAWGNFATIVINFVLLALIIFWMIKAINRLKREAPPAPAPAPAEDIVLLREIRDALKK
jgi:large conductance mechanosensitive channel